MPTSLGAYLEGGPHGRGLHKAIKGGGQSIIYLDLLWFTLYLGGPNDTLAPLYSLGEAAAMRLPLYLRPCMHPLLLKGDWNDYGVGGGH